MIHEPISNTQNTCYFIEISLLILVQYRLLFHYFANFTSSKTKKNFKFLRITRGMNFKYSKTCPRFIKTPPTAPNLSDVPLKKRKRKREANKRASSLNPSASILHFLSLYSFPRFLEQRRVTRKKASTAASGGGRREGGNG